MAWVRPLPTRAAADPRNEYIRYRTSSLGVTERSDVSDAQIRQDAVLSGEQQDVHTLSGYNGDDEDTEVVENSRYSKPLPRIQQNPRSRQMNMVHTNLVTPVTFPPDETDSPQRLHCVKSFNLAAVSYDTKLYSYGGAVKRVWFPAGGNDWDPEDVMLCQSSSCKQCSPTIQHDQLVGQSLTLGLPFVHRGRDCSSRDVPTVILTRRDDGFSFHREVRRICTIEFKPAAEPAEDDDPADKLVKGFGLVRKDIPPVLENKLVKFGQWNAQEAAVCVPSECPKCATPKFEMDYGD